ncbi:MAG: MATE family efflux transporter, partial [Rikenellaceae bacterium]
MNKKILKLAIPNIISNITIPLLGMADLAIAGQLGDYRYLGAIGIGVSIFNLIYWNFGFLRMGTSGFTAQAFGARNFKECTNILIRALVVSVFFAVIIIAAQIPFSKGALYILNSSSETASLAMDYFSVRIWAAPATLALYACKGWFIGMQNSNTPMYIAITMNIINISTSILFAFTFDMGIKGIALGTLVSQYSGVLFSLIVMRTRYKRVLRHLSPLKEIMSLSKMQRFFYVNRDIFLRTVCLSAVFTFYTSASSAMGEDILAVNTLLLQLFILFSYFMDGFAYAGEALIGRYTGSQNITLLKKSIKLLVIWGLYISIPFTIAYALFLTPILSLFTDSSEVLSAALDFRWWITAVPIMSFLAFIFDGILIGATQSATMRNAMFAATTVFFISYYSLQNIAGSNALWIAFLSYMLLRGIMQA